MNKSYALMMYNLDMGTKCIKFLLSGFKIHARTACFDTFFLYFYI